MTDTKEVTIYQPDAFDRRTFGSTDDEEVGQKKHLLVALEASYGILTPALKVVGIGRKKFYAWYNNDPEFKEHVDDIIEEQKDYVESQLLNGIRNSKEQSILFYLRTKAKDRGYVEKKELEVKDVEKFTSEDVRDVEEMAQYLLNKRKDTTVDGTLNPRTGKQGTAGSGSSDAEAEYAHVYSKNVQDS